jgi:arginyl-tRNA synthetase
MILIAYKKHFALLLAPIVQLDIETVVAMIEMPPNPEMGDLAFPCFTLAKTLKKAPQVLASEIVSQIDSNLGVQFSKVHAVGPYVNMFVHKNAYVKEVLEHDRDVSLRSTWQETSVTWLDLRSTWQEWNIVWNAGKILLEYMSGNPNKPLHVGHARNVCIGDTLRRTYLAAWYTIETSHYGDDSWVNVWYNIVGHLYYGLPLESDKKFDHYCGDVYLHMRAKDEDPEFKEKLSKTLHAVEHDSDPAITKLHKEYVKKCTIEQLKSCWRVGASFTMINWETDILHLNLFAEAIEILKQKWHVVFAEDGDAKGCWIIDLSSLPLYQKEEKQYAILVKSDWVATYVAKDIAFAMRKLGYLKKDFFFHEFVTQPAWWVVYSTTSDEHKHEDIHFSWYNNAITIIDNRQIPAQMVVKSSLELLGLLTPEKQYTPLWYGVVYLTPNTLLKWWFELSDEEKGMARLPFASRKWRTVTMDSMLDLLFARAYEETKKRNADVNDEQLQLTAESIAISSFRFFLTKTDIMKDITFDIDEVLDMEGETWAYVLYTNARIKAVLAKSKETSLQDSLTVENNLSLLVHPLEIQLVKKIDELSSVIQETLKGLAPHLLNRYLISASQLFNTYYNEVNVSKSEAAEKSARVFLLERFGATLEKAMWLLGMKPVERM